MAIRTFRDKSSEDICHGIASKGARKCLPTPLHEKARIKLARLAAATGLNDLAELRGNRFEMLKGERAGQYSIRINDQFRICFRWEGTDAFDVEITDYH
jgi:proteic killer suppression protein